MISYNLVFCLIGISISLPLINGQARLFQGSFDDLNQYRYHVALLRVYANDTTEMICGGAIIAPRYVLTAAHCIYDLQKSDLLVRSGWDVTPEHPYEEKRSYHKVAKIMYLRDYFHTYCRHHEHDIAILKVERNFDLADESQYKRVNLPQPDNDYDGYDVVFTGYGIHKIRKLIKNTTHEVIKEIPLYPDKLKYVETVVIPNEKCKRSASAIITKTNICTQAVNPDGFSCLGDDGGPLVHDGVVIGIRNSHNNECLHYEPELFTRVSSYLSFINKVLNHEDSYDIVYI